MTARVLAALAVADLRDRARRPAFLIVLLAAAGLGYLAVPPASADYAMVKLGAFRGVYDSGYLGTVLALVAALWLSLCGFLVVKNTIAGDTATGVGQILAATPMSRAAYLLGKFLSNFLVLAAMAGAVALTGPGMQLLRGESTGIDPVALVLPFLLLCLPLLAVSAAMALLFESVPVLSGGAGNIVWFFSFLLAVLAGTVSGVLDGVVAGMRADLLAQHPDAGPTEFSLGLTFEEDGMELFHWSGLEVTGSLLALTAGCLLAAVVTALLPSLWFARFDPSGQRLPGPVAAGATVGGTAPTTPEPPGAVAFAAAVRPRVAVVRGNALAGLLAGELRLLLKGRSRWWWLGVAGLTAAGLLVPVGSGLGTVLLLAWIWPVLLWSRLGAQASDHDVLGLLDAAPSPLRRPLAEWAAGVAVAALTGAGPLLRMLVEADGAGAAAWLGGAVFVPALAVALGSLSRSAHLFQLVYLALWYMTLNGLPFVDVMGAVRDGDGPAGPHPLLVLAVGAALLAAALLGRRIRHARR